MIYDVVIAGAGLGGLECGYILSKKGFNVCVLEKNPLPGGCLQTFARSGKLFDTGFHYVGGMDKGQPLNKLFEFFGLNSLPWHKLDSDGFDQVFISDKSYMFVNGYNNFLHKMCEYFPDSAADLKTYTEFLKKVGTGIFNSFSGSGIDNFSDGSLFAHGAYEYLCNTLKNVSLQNVVSGTSLKMELNKEKLPLYTFAQINSSYIQSAYRIKGGGMQIARNLIDSIKSMGGTVMLNSEIEKFKEDGDKIGFAVLKNGSQIAGKYFISDIHPSVTVKLAQDTPFIRRIYKNRMNSLENGFGMFTVNISLKPGMLKYLNRNIYIHCDEDVWNEGQKLNDKSRCALVSFVVPEKGDFAETVDILTPMLWSDVEKFNGSKVGRRGDEYETLKHNKAEELIGLADKYIPGLKNAVDKYYTSTPLTYSDYTSTVNGSVYGITKDYNKLMYTLLAPKTPAPNLFLTGQNLNLHGILGVSMTSFFTCAEIAGEIPFRDQLVN